MDYHFSGEEETDSPSLVYYLDVIEENIERALTLAGGAERLWPHIKTHKTSGVLKMQMEKGITRFKCATIAEAELCAMSGVPDVLVAYPLVGPAAGRFIKLREKYTDTSFRAIGDDLAQLEFLGKAALLSAGKKPVSVLIDVNLGMNRTGVPLERLEEFCVNASGISGLNVQGFHCYDGHLGITDLDKRRAAVNLAAEKFWTVKKSLEKKGFVFPFIVMGGTPTFACHRETPGVYLSPGTFFVQDSGYRSKFPDLDFTPGAAILTRVISRPGPDLFTLDTGTKAVASDPEQAGRGIIDGMPGAVPVSQSEEHWVWKLEDGRLPSVGTVLYIIPAHICPTSALYPEVLVIKNKKPAGYWEVGARNRKITV